LWLLCALLALYSYQRIWILPLLVYPTIPLLVLSGRAQLEKTYWLFPYLNGALGCYFFWLIFIQRFIAV
jgi:hypothetical protein